jgi:hypothetical protein
MQPDIKPSLPLQGSAAYHCQDLTTFFLLPV